MDCLGHEDLQVQQSAAKNFSFLASDTAGCQKLLEANAIVFLLDAADNGDIGTALECFSSLLVAAKKECVRSYFLNNHDLLSKLLAISKGGAVLEKASAALKLVHLVLEGRYNEETIEFLLKSDAIGICAGYLSSASADVKHSASTVLAFLSVSDAGKETAIAWNVVEPLVDMACTKDRKLQYSSSSCLMALAVANSGKAAFNALDESKLKTCIAMLLDSEDEFIIMNALQIIAAAAEHDKVRASLKPFTGKLNAMKDSLPNYVSHHLAYAVRQLGFLNLPYTKLVH